MNEKMKDLLKLINVELITNRSMTTDEILECIGCTVDEDGEIIDSGGNATGIWYEEVEY